MQPKWCRCGCFFIGVVVLTFLFGCDTTQVTIDQRPEKPWAGRTLQVATDDPVGQELLRRHGSIWESDTGARLDVIQRRFDAHLSEADAGLIPPMDLGQLATGELTLAPVPSELRAVNAAFGWSKLLPVYRDNLLFWGDRRRPLALPVLGEGMVMVYRSDLLMDAEHQRAFREMYRQDLTAPETWEDVARIGEYFTRVRGVPALTPLPSSDLDLERAFLSVVAPHDRRARRSGDLRADRTESDATTSELFSFQYEIDTMRPRLDAPAFRHALNWFRSTSSSRPPEPSPTPWQSFAEDRAVVAVVPLIALPKIRDSGLSFDIGQILGSRFVFDEQGRRESIGVGVNRVPYFGAGGLLAVVRDDRDATDMAFDLFARLASSSGSSTTLAEPAVFGSGPIRITQTDKTRQTLWYAYGLNERQTSNLIDAVKEQVPGDLLNPTMRLRIPEARERIEVFGIHLREAMASDQEPEVALGKAVAAWQALDETIPVDEFRRLYRVSLGLGG